MDHFEQFAGAVLQPSAAPLTDHQFLRLCEQYPDYRIESTAEGDILIMPPAHTKTGHRNAAITAQLFAWAEEDGRGEAFDSSAGFVLRNGARRSPDSAWASAERMKGLDDAALWHVTPDFVIELKSASDQVDVLRAKMREWTGNGVTLGWLINPESRSVKVYRADGSVTEVLGATEMHGDGPVSGFVLKLSRIWKGIHS